MRLNPLSFGARYSRLVLLAGLAIGILMPGLAASMSPWVPEMVVGIMFLGALRLSPGDVRGLRTNVLQVLGLVLILQLLLPLVVLSVAFALGQQSAPLTFALILFACAPPIVGSPSIAAIMGLNAAVAMQFLIIGTLLLPLTVLPVFWLLPSLGSFDIVVSAAIRLLISIGIAGGGALLVRALFFPRPSVAVTENLDGASVIGLSVFVVALMPAVAGAMTQNTAVFMFWLVAAFGINFGAQYIARQCAGKRAPAPTSGAFALVAGNRNIALFFAALPLDVTAPLLVFLGCYQLPMFLTPIIMRRFYAS